MTCAPPALAASPATTPNSPDPETQTFDLSRLCRPERPAALLVHDRLGHHLPGAFVDNVHGHVRAATTLFADDAESGDAKWTYAAPWVRSDGTQTFTQNFYLQWRNVSANGGYDSALGDSRWRYGPANTGLLVWYNNNFYTDNEIVQLPARLSQASAPRAGCWSSTPSRAVPRPGMVAAGYNNEGGNTDHRGQMRDAPFSLSDTVPFTSPTLCGLIRLRITVPGPAGDTCVP